MFALLVNLSAAYSSSSIFSENIIDLTRHIRDGHFAVDDRNLALLLIVIDERGSLRMILRQAGLNLARIVVCAALESMVAALVTLPRHGRTLECVVIAF